jgi:hypothetical protein
MRLSLVVVFSSCLFVLPQVFSVNDLQKKKEGTREMNSDEEREMEIEG